MRRRDHLWLYSTTGWNRLVDHYFRNRIRQVLAIPATPWRPPWFTQVRWDVETETFLASVKPGACVSASSDGDPVLKVDQVHASTETMRRLDLLPGGDETGLEAYLSEESPLALRPNLFRAIGTDAVGTGDQPAEAVPPFFSARNVVGATVLEETASGLVSRVEGFVAARENARLLRACDIVLSHDRLQTAPALVQSGENSALEFGLHRDPSYRPDPFLFPTRKWEPAFDFGALDFSLGLVTDDGRDEIHLATVYLLSQPGAEPGTEPDGTWEPWVQHHVSWNLKYLTRYTEQAPDPTRIEVPVPFLGAGALGGLGQQFVDDLNGRISEIEAALTQVRNEGRFSML